MEITKVKLQDLLQIDLPIIQAPMAGVQDAALAVAVSNAGGLGSLPCAMLDPASIHKELAYLTSHTTKPYNVNFFCHTPPTPDAEREAVWRAKLAPYYEEYGINPAEIVPEPERRPFNSDAADVLEDFKPSIVSFHFGLPSPDLLARVKSWGARILSSATTLKEAMWLEAHGVDAIIAQGYEAGGHRGMFLSTDLTTQVGTMSLLRQILQNVKIPVIAAGGIGDTKGITTAIKAGAAGVQIGTAYLLCPEATTRPIHRAALKSDQRYHTAVTNIFSGRPARGIINRAIKELGPICDAAPAFPWASAAIAPLRAKAESNNKGDFSPLWAGQCTDGCKETSATVLTRELASGILT